MIKSISNVTRIAVKVTTRRKVNSLNAADITYVLKLLSLFSFNKRYGRYVSVIKKFATNEFLKHLIVNLEKIGKGTSPEVFLKNNNSFWS